MKFAHLSDCHLGSWRDPKLRTANANSFIWAISHCIEKEVDFVLISGDLFNTAVPSIDSLKLSVEQLKKLNDKNIPVYIIAGSHDYSPSGKTMLDVLEQAGLVINVAKGEVTSENKLKLHFTVDKKTNAKIVGMPGRRGGLEKNYYYQLEKQNLESESGSKIFLFHSALSELKPKGMEQMDAMPISMLPENFDYYAGGHVHVIDHATINNRKNIIYPGPIFPNNFAEIEKLRQGNFVMVENWAITNVPIKIHPAVCISVDAEGKSPSDVVNKIKEELKQIVKNSIVTIRVSGCLEKGKPSELPWNDIVFEAYSKGAHIVLKNTSALFSKEIEVIMTKATDVDEIESSVLKEHAGILKLTENDSARARKLMHALSIEKQDGEKNIDFESRIISEIDVLLQ